MKRLAWGVAGFVCILAGACAPGPAADAPLYERIGGYDAIAGVTDDFLGRLVADTAIKPYFEGLPDSVMRRIRQRVVDQLCEASGGPCFYLGKSMKEAHATLEITPEVWQLAVSHLEATFGAFAVPPREQSELLALIGPMKADIVAGGSQQ